MQTDWINKRKKERKKERKAYGKNLNGNEWMKEGRKEERDKVEEIDKIAKNSLILCY